MTIRVIVLMAFWLAFAAGCAPRTGPFWAMVPEGSVCGDWSRIAEGPYILSNNVWGKCDREKTDCISRYDQCIHVGQGAKSDIFTWAWDWPSWQDDRVKASPGIVFGWKPWDRKSTTPKLPRKLSEVRHMTASFDASVAASGVYNVALDMWITSSPKPSPGRRTREIMIWLDDSHWDRRIEGDRVVIGGEEYDFHKGTVKNGGWTYIVFFKVSPKYKGTVPIHEFLQYLIKNRHVSRDEYLASIEFMNEIVEGTGKAEVREYEIVVK